MSTNNILSQMTEKIAEDSGDGIVVRKAIPLAALNLGSNVAIAANETNGLVAKVVFTNNVVFNQDWLIPIDYDENSDSLKLRVLVGQEAIGTDDDVLLDMELYKKTAGSALSADLGPAIQTTVLAVAEAWFEFDLSGHGFSASDIAILKLITNGLNDTATDEVMLFAAEVEYKSLIVASNLSDRA